MGRLEPDGAASAWVPTYGVGAVVAVAVAFFLPLGLVAFLPFYLALSASSACATCLCRMSSADSNPRSAAGAWPAGAGSGAARGVCGAGGVGAGGWGVVWGGASGGSGGADVAKTWGGCVGTSTLMSATIPPECSSPCVQSAPCSIFSIPIFINLLPG